ncbi:hypothetical protein [Thermomonospora cellulosilytica]|uniref:Uncharacterized protein n=1 Tax=Thermomonospora cellulosilytica TaxID=1411118 RepID=A0A7W3R8X4_9ACTN|nr:hypothetical protein [Thermomonospora cellulosilytica]MBA9003765.1 hypothetical protein [Thermomonospora cellulosilytica]
MISPAVDTLFPVLVEPSSDGTGGWTATCRNPRCEDAPHVIARRGTPEEAQRAADPHRKEVNR